MFTLKYAELLISAMTFFLAYATVVTVAGSFRAWIARLVGDHTGEDLGLLTLNPINHVDFVGLIFLFIFFFGWGRYVPINPFNIHEPNRWLKLLLAYLSDTFAYFFSALIGVFILTVAFGPRMLFIAHNMLVCFQNMTHLYLVETCPTLSTIAITLSFLIIAIVYLNVVLGVLNLILNGCSLVMFFIMERSPRYAQYNNYIIILVPILIIFLFSEPLRLMAIHIISFTGYGIAKLFRLV